MSATFDAATTAAYQAATTAAARAAAIVASLTGTISVKVFNGSNVEMGAGTMAAPWSTASGGVVTLGEVASFEVGTTGTPDAGWYIRFQNGDATRWVRGSFGLLGSGQDFTWSLATWEVGQAGNIGTATIIASGNEAPAFTVAPGTVNLPSAGGTVQFTAVDPDGSEVVYTLPTTRAGITINASTGLVTVTSAAAGTSGAVTVAASDGILTTTHVCNVIVAQSGAALEWSPGHALATSGSIGWPSPNEINNVANAVNSRSYINALVIRPTWKDVETSQGQYNWSVIDHALSVLGSSKKLWVQFMFARFNTGTSDGSVVAPAYLLTPTYQGGVFADLKDSGLYDINLKMWLPSVMGRYVAMLAALGARYASEPRLAGLINSEMAFGNNLDDPNATFDGATAVNLITDTLIPALRSAMPSKCFQMYTNFISDGNDVPDKYERVQAAVRAHDGILSGPDTDPAIGGKKGLQYARGVLGSPAVDHRGLIGMGCGCQSRDIGTNDDYSETWTGQQYVEWMYDVQQATHIVWTYIPAGPKFQQAMAYLAANPSKYRSAYPSEYPAA